MYTIFVVSIVIIIVVLLLAVITTSKAYSFKHTVDPLDDNPYVNNDKKEENEKNS
ncbi:YtzI protein [Neobacillus sp. YX16]|uniref:YtzI protein n=1 Tax=Bacillaceae TaxID=186817 RepID=UPI000BA4F0D2|nr:MULTISPECIES: YtzI protein [Bacillaceae]PAE34239.1 YtzI protein [Bacillus sp. 7884-1]TDL77557.1 YtzI protein [Rhodococcus qingshengii]WHZ02088.1 YtzI protein [Neobacillus sp. YX16]